VFAPFEVGFSVPSQRDARGELERPDHTSRAAQSHLSSRSEQSEQFWRSSMALTMATGNASLEWSNELVLDGQTERHGQ
jgi:hypothetical protein